MITGTIKTKAYSLRSEVGIGSEKTARWDCSRRTMSVSDSFAAVGVKRS